MTCWALFIAVWHVLCFPIHKLTCFQSIYWIILCEVKHKNPFWYCLRLYFSRGIFLLMFKSVSSLAAYSLSRIINQTRHIFVTVAHSEHKLRQLKARSSRASVWFEIVLFPVCVRIELTVRSDIILLTDIGFYQIFKIIRYTQTQNVTCATLSWEMKSWEDMMTRRRVYFMTSWVLFAIFKQFKLI